MPSSATSPRLQRVAAAARLAARFDGARTRLASLREEGAAKIRFPVTQSPALEAILINTAGGLTGGDRMTWAVEIGADASAVLTTQACEKAYRAHEGHACIEVDIRVGARGRLAWVPQETIVYEGGALRRRIEVDLADGAELLMVEATAFGRLARGEHLDRASFADHWRVRVGTHLVHAESFAVGGEAGRILTRPATMGAGACMATVLLIGDGASSLLDPARKLASAAGGVSFWEVAGTGKLLARLVAADSYELRKSLVPLLELMDRQASLPKVWSL
jgi:urease accessory protein